jgi:hypothetical protein
MADAAKLGCALADAGLKDIQVETVTQRMEFESGSEMWNWVVNSNPIGAMLVADLTGEQERAVQLALDGMLRGRAKGSGPAILTDPNHIGVGTK